MITGLVGADVMLAMAAILLVVMSLMQTETTRSERDPAAQWIAMRDGLWLSPHSHLPLETLTTATLPLPASMPVTLIVTPDGLDAAFLTESRLAQLGAQEITLIRRSRACQPITLADQRLSCAP
ncbi:hypothetical protein [Phaeobacter sp. HF9A]|uniref:hypothetical protein n=1 Tax=Phaeobacter sp. HF9A TaxID=2721561 RepID=UPI0014318BE7|nr:hypothetical protein [Phaeobacter sp. HF9A]NIZ12015.1 hypothetical protein [Phaeobacter sp. HF9A]